MRQSVKQVIWIDNSEFVCDMAKYIFEAEGVHCFTIWNPMDETFDYEYTLNDLQPDFIMIDIATIVDQADSFSQRFLPALDKLADHVIWGIGNQVDLQKIDEDKFKFDKIIQKPLSPLLLRDLAMNKGVVA